MQITSSSESPRFNFSRLPVGRRADESEVRIVYRRMVHKDLEDRGMGRRHEAVRTCALRRESRVVRRQQSRVAIPTQAEVGSEQ